MCPIGIKNLKRTGRYPASRYERKISRESSPRDFLLDLVTCLTSRRLFVQEEYNEGLSSCYHCEIQSVTGTGNHNSVMLADVTVASLFSEANSNSNNDWGLRGFAGCNNLNRGRE